MPLEIENPTRIPNDFVIFYCWQGHLNKKHHRYLIRTALNNAINRVQAELPDNVNCNLRIDSDTEGQAGSVDIANSILLKILTSTMVVGDVTIVLRDDKNKLYYPNPNVMVEIGYGAKTLGWNRVVCVFNAGRNENNEKVREDDLPFDIKYRRINSYVCSADSGIAQATKELEAEFVASIRAVIQEIDRGVFDPSLSDAAIKRGKDIRLLKLLLNQIHRSSMDRYVEAGKRDKLYDDCDFFWFGFDALVCSSHFRFYDKDLEQLVIDLSIVWRSAVNLSGYIFYPSHIPGSFSLKNEHDWDVGYEAKVNKWRQAIDDLPRIFSAFLDHIHDKFPTIDLDESDRIAWINNLPYIGGGDSKPEYELEVAPDKSPDVQA